MQGISVNHADRPPPPAVVVVLFTEVVVVVGPTDVVVHVTEVVVEECTEVDDPPVSVPLPPQPIIRAPTVMTVAMNAYKKCRRGFIENLLCRAERPRIGGIFSVGYNTKKKKGVKRFFLFVFSCSFLVLSCSEEVPSVGHLTSVRKQYRMKVCIPYFLSFPGSTCPFTPMG